MFDRVHERVETWWRPTHSAGERPGITLSFCYVPERPHRDLNRLRAERRNTTTAQAFPSKRCRFDWFGRAALSPGFLPTPLVSPWFMESSWRVSSACLPARQADNRTPGVGA